MNAESLRARARDAVEVRDRRAGIRARHQRPPLAVPVLDASPRPGAAQLRASSPSKPTDDTALRAPARAIVLSTVFVAPAGLMAHWQQFLGPQLLPFQSRHHEVRSCPSYRSLTKSPGRTSEDSSMLAARGIGSEAHGLNVTMQSLTAPFTADVGRRPARTRDRLARPRRHPFTRVLWRSCRRSTKTSSRTPRRWCSLLRSRLFAGSSGTQPRFQAGAWSRWRSRR